MGSTTVEASKYCVPTINASPYEYKFKTTGYFSDNPHAEIDTDFGEQDGRWLLGKFISYNQEQKLLIGLECRKTFEKVFAIEAHYNKIMRFYKLSRKILEGGE